MKRFGQYLLVIMSLTLLNLGASQAAAPLAADKIKLVKVVGGKSFRQADIRFAGSLHRMRLGNRVDRWQIVAINRNSIELACISRCAKRYEQISVG